MHHQMYYLISPRVHLQEKLAAAPDFAYLARPLLWSGEEYDLERGDFRECFNGVIKVLFLDSLRREWAAQPDYPRLFADLAATEAYFDAHWQLQRLWLDMERGEAMGAAHSSGSLGGLRDTGNLWADSVFERERMMRR